MQILADLTRSLYETYPVQGDHRHAIILNPDGVILALHVQDAEFPTQYVALQEIELLDLDALVTSLKHLVPPPKSAKRQRRIVAPVNKLTA